MLLQNQRKAIQDAVNRGEVLTVEMGSALLAAFEEAELAQINVSQQLDVANHQKTHLQWTHDEAERLRREMERDIDIRVTSRTADLRRQLSDAQFEAKKQEDRAEYVNKCLEHAQDEFLRREKNYRFTIRNLKELVESNLKPSFLSRLTWKIKARRALAEVAGLLPDEKQ